MAPKPFLIGLLIVISLNLNLAAQDNGCTSRTVPVGVVDREWNLVRGLSAANFRANLHGQEVKILSAAIDTSPRHIVLLLDASGSMMEPDQKRRGQHKPGEAEKGGGGAPQSGNPSFRGRHRR
jgi:hypothetical protein